MADTINLEENSKYRVALDLMKYVAANEDVPTDKKLRREYFLNLYNQCIEVVGYRRTYEDVKGLASASEDDYAVGGGYRY